MKSRGSAHLAALGLISVMLQCVIVKTVELADLTEMHKTTALEKQDLSCTYLAHHELESKTILVVIIVTW